MPEIANGMWKFTGRERRFSSAVYLRDDEIIGAIVDDAHASDPRLRLLTLHSGIIDINWVEHHEEIISYLEGEANVHERVPDSLR